MGWGLIGIRVGGVINRKMKKKLIVKQNCQAGSLMKGLSQN